MKDFIQDTTVIKDDVLFHLYDKWLNSTDEADKHYKRAAQMVEAISRKPFNLDHFQYISEVVMDGLEEVKDTESFRYLGDDFNIVEFVKSGLNLVKGGDFDKDIFISNNTHPIIHYSIGVIEMLDKEIADWVLSDVCYFAPIDMRENNDEFFYNYSPLSQVIWAKVLKDVKGQYKFKKVKKEKELQTL